MDQRAPVLARLRAAGKRYGAVTALDGVDLELHGGEVLALLGANGAGKTTAIALLLGLLQADAGDAELSGLSPRSLHARRHAGIMLQSAALQDTLKVRELLDLTRSYYPDPRSVADCVALAGLDGLMERRYGKLSGGQQRRVQFALAICGRPRVLFLDEPTTGLDIEARRGLWRAIRELVAQGSGVLLTTHYLEEAEALADRVVRAGAWPRGRRRQRAGGARARLAASHPLRVLRRCRQRSRAGRRCRSAVRDGDCIEIVSRGGARTWCAVCWPRTPACATWKCSAPAWPTPSSNSPATTSPQASSPRQPCRRPRDARHRRSPSDAHSPLRCYQLEAKYEFLRLLRTPIFVLPTMLFPALFYLLFGVAARLARRRRRRALPAGDLRRVRGDGRRRCSASA